MLQLIQQENTLQMQFSVIPDGLFSNISYSISRAEANLDELEILARRSPQFQSVLVLLVKVVWGKLMLFGAKHTPKKFYDRESPCLWYESSFVYSWRLKIENVTKDLTNSLLPLLIMVLGLWSQNIQDKSILMPNSPKVSSSLPKIWPNCRETMVFKGERSALYVNCAFFSLKINISNWK